MTTMHAAGAHTHTRTFRWISLLAIVVSFAHMAATMLLFERATWWAQIVGAGNTLLVDLTIWGLIEYRHWAHQQGLTYSQWVDRLLGLALILAVGLNAGSLWAHRPPDAVLSSWLALPLIVGFSILVPGLIAVGSLIRGEIAGHGATQTDLRQQVADLAQQLAAALTSRDTARHDLTQVRQALESLRQTMAQHQTEVAQYRDAAAHHDASRHRLEADVTSLRQQLTQSQQETTQARQAALLMRQEHDEQLRALRQEAERQRHQLALTDDAATLDIAGQRYTTRQLAQAFETSETTARRRLAEIKKEHSA